MFKTEDAAQIYDIHSGQISTHATDVLPGYLQGGYCVMNETTVLIGRRQHEFKVLGTYQVDLKSGKTRRVGKNAFYDPHYVKDMVLLQNCVRGTMKTEIPESESIKE